MSKSQKKTGTKSTSYPGKSYFETAAKQFCWPLNWDDKTILVPESELWLAEDHLIVAHFRSYGWHIQSCIDVVKTIPFVAPITVGPIFRQPPKLLDAETKYRCGQKFKIVSTECEVQIIEVSKKIELHYTNRNKPDLTTNEVNLDRVLKMGLWKEI